MSAARTCSARVTESSFALTNRIRVSAHSYVDIIDALANATPITHYNMVTVLLEQLAYRANPEASYELMGA
jgi:hypothetical protein